MNKLGTAIGGLLLIGALAAPVAFAHYDTGNAPLANTVFGDHTPYATENRVAGWYYASTNTYTELVSDFELDNPADPTSCPDDVAETEDVDENALCVALTSDVNPGFLFAQWGGFGDIEVGGPGDCGDVADETEVDGSAGGDQEDGTFNDGGYGYIGHTDHYACDDYNTSGCGPNAAAGIVGYAPAYGEDIAVGSDVWLATQCNWGIPVAGDAPGLVDIVLQFVGDVINCPFGGFPQSCLDAVAYLTDCLGLTQGGSCGDSDDAVVCGNGDVSTTNFGTPGAFGSGPGVAFPPAGVDSDGVNCHTSATAAVFPFTALIVTLDEDGNVDSTYTSTATVGWVG